MRGFFVHLWGNIARYGFLFSVINSYCPAGPPWLSVAQGLTMSKFAALEITNFIGW